MRMFERTEMLRSLARRLPRTANAYRDTIQPVSLSAKRPLVRRRFARAIAIAEAPSLELGSGGRAGLGPWITVDSARGADMRWDLRHGLPVPDESISRIYTSHFPEHLNFSHIMALLNECYRSLEPAGELSVCVPTIEPYIRAYIDRREHRPRTEWANPVFADSGALLDQVNYIAYYGGEHKMMFDEETLVCVLQRAGFRDVELREFDSGLDLAERQENSIFAVGRK